MNWTRLFSQGRQCAGSRLICTAVIINGVVAIISSVPSPAQTQRDLDLCSRSSHEQKINSCTAVINSGTQLGAGLGAAFYNRALGFNQIANYLAAISDFDAALGINLRDVDALVGRGNAKIRAAKIVVGLPPSALYDEAIEDFTRAMSIDSYNAIAYSNRGVAYELTGRMDLAIADYRKAFSLGHTESYNTLRKLGAAPTVEQKGEFRPEQVCAGIDNACIDLCNRTCGSRAVRLCTYSHGCSGGCIAWCR